MNLCHPSPLTKERFENMLLLLRWYYFTDTKKTNHSFIGNNAIVTYFTKPIFNPLTKLYQQEKHPHYNEQSSQLPEHDKWENSLWFSRTPQNAIRVGIRVRGRKTIVGQQSRKGSMSFFFLFCFLQLNATS